jgi:cytochrome d ubiquinol oxidase subunit I
MALPLPIKRRKVAHPGVTRRVESDMTDLLAARSQMAMSLGFHMFFAVVGMAMPLLMVIAEGLWLRTREPDYRELAHRWAKGTAILFAVGAVSGTVLSFELGLLWPTFMRHAGPVIGMPFSLEGFAFFLEAIFLGIWLYGWDRVSPLIHWLSGVAVLVSGTASGVFVVMANAWMNTPAGFSIVGGEIRDVNVWAAMLNPAAPTQVTHMAIAAFQAVAFAVAAIHAWVLLRQPGQGFHQRAFAIALGVAIVSGVLQPISGDFSAKQIARNQPAKLAAAEAHWETRAAAPLSIGGWPDEVAETTSWALEIPYGLSFLAHGDPNAAVTGLKDIPKQDRPPVAVVHVAFQAMVGMGMYMAAVALAAAVLWRRRKRVPLDPWLLKALVVAGPMGMLSVQAGWVVTEVGRQPWVIHGFLRTADAVTPMPYLIVPFLTFTLLYLVLAVVVVLLMKRQVFASPGLAATDKAQGGATATDRGDA